MILWVKSQQQKSAPILDAWGFPWSEFVKETCLQIGGHGTRKQTPNHGAPNFERFFSFQMRRKSHDGCRWGDLGSIGTEEEWVTYIAYIMSLLIIVISCNVPIRFISKLSLVLGVVPQDKKLSPESTGQAFGEAWQAFGGWYDIMFYHGLPNDLGKGMFFGVAKTLVHSG